VQKKFLLRISPKLYEQLERWAQEELRSVNGQIEYLLREAVQRHHPTQIIEATEPIEEDEDVDA
jgi:hypothetical protein